MTGHDHRHVHAGDGSGGRHHAGPGFHDDAFVPRLVDGAVLQLVGDEAIAWAPGAASPVLLDPPRAVLAQLVDGVGSNAELAEDISEGLGLEPVVARFFLNNMLVALEIAGVLDHPDHRPPGLAVPRVGLPQPDW